MTDQTSKHREAVSRAYALLSKCVTAHGFLASPTDSDNYRRIWGRDGIIIGLAALMTGDGNLIAALSDTLRTLAAHQGPHGEIPSNVDVHSGRVSYGGMTGFYAADLAKRGAVERASRYLAGIHAANALPMNDEPWGFAECVNGSKFSAGGNRHQCWSASAALMGHYALEGKKVFTIHENHSPVQ